MSETIFLSVILPLYNERDNLVPLLQEIDGALVDLKRPFEIILVDDGSSDGTAQLAEAQAQKNPHIRALLFRANSGQTAALDAGFRHARGELIVTMDADRQNDPRDIPAMLAMIERGLDCVVGWRKERRDGWLLRKLPSRIANALIRRAWRTRQHDLGCALKVFRREIAQELRLYGEMHRFIGILLEGMGARVGEYVVHHRPRTAGRSKYGLTRVFKVALDLITLWFLQGFRAKPIYVFGSLGVGLIGSSGVISLFVIWEKIFRDVSLNRNPLFTLSIFLVVIGTQFIVLGLLAELIIRIYFESSQQRPYSIARRIGFEREGTEKRTAA
jgi:glycosyltransferase involved in cell wall biosynthesis